MNKLNPTEEITKKVNDLKQSLHNAALGPDPDVCNKLQSEIYQYLETYNWSDVVFEENGKQGLKDCSGKVIAQAIYDEIIPREHCFTNVHIPACINGKWGLIPPNADINIYKEGFVYDDIEAFWGDFLWGGVYKVVFNKLVGLINGKGRELMPCVADEVYPFSNGMALVVKDGKYGFLTDDYDYIEPVYDEIDFPELGDYYNVRLGEQWGCVDNNKQFTLGEDEGGTPAYYGCFD